MEDIDNEHKFSILKKLYYNPSNPGSFGGISSLLKEAKKYIENITENEVKDWLSGELVYTLHKQARRRFKRNQTVAEKPYELFQADLVDMREFSNQNKGYNYILTVIDVFSKKAFAISLKNKNQISVSEAMEKIISKKSPFKLMTDKGKEFENTKFSDLMKKYNIHHYFSKNRETKCAVVERFNKTLKNKMFRYFTLNGNRKYLDVLDNLLEAYNNSYHRSIRMAPNQVSYLNSKLVFKNLFGFEDKREYLRKLRQPKHSTGVTVRKKYNLNKLDRGYYPNWSDENFKIYKSISGNSKPYYHLEDESGKVDKKRYYPEEIQKVKSNLFRVEKVIKERKYRGRKQYFVKWLNFPDTRNSWIDSGDLTSING